MPASFTVVQYVPDPVRNERLNVGIIVFGEGRVHTRFIESWNRVRAFGEENIEFIRSFAHHASLLTETKIREIAGTWQASIQLTAPAGSMLSPSDLLLDAASRYLRDWSPQAREFRNRKQAVSLTRSAVRKAVIDRLGASGRRLVRNNLPLTGPRGPHEFDVGAENGKPCFAARALSFEGGWSSDLLRQIESTEFAIEDVRRGDDKIPLAVVFLPPRLRDEDELYQRATDNLGQLPVRIIEEQRLPEWAEEMANLLGESRMST